MTKQYKRFLNTFLYSFFAFQVTANLAQTVPPEVEPLFNKVIEILDAHKATDEEFEEKIPADVKVLLDSFMGSNGTSADLSELSFQGAEGEYSVILGSNGWFLGEESLIDLVNKELVGTPFELKKKSLPIAGTQQGFQIDETMFQMYSSQPDVTDLANGSGESGGVIFLMTVVDYSQFLPMLNGQPVILFAFFAAIPSEEAEFN